MITNFHKPHIIPHPMLPQFRIPFGNRNEETQYATPEAKPIIVNDILPDAESTLDQDLLRYGNGTGWSTQTKNEAHGVRKRLPSILKTSPSRTFTEPVNSSSTPLPGAQPPLRTPPRMGRVVFSPTKEVMRYEEDNGERVFRTEPEGNTTDDKTNPRPSFLNNYTIPYILLMYLQLLFNVLLALIIFYIIYLFISTIKADTRHKMEIATTDALREISLCSREFYRNKCATNHRAPALEVPCLEWEKCMNRDPEKIGKSLVTAQTFGEIINEFLKPISWKLVFLCNFLLIGSFVATNILLGGFRGGMSYDQLDNLRKLKALEDRLNAAENEMESLRKSNAELKKQAPTYLSQHELDLMNESIGYSPLMAKLRR